MGKSEPKCSRRTLFVGGGIAAAGILGMPRTAWASGVTGLNEADDAITTPLEAIIKTKAGPIRGYRQGKTYIFKGVPYAASTAGANRFLPPRDLANWTETRLALNYGQICPQPAWNSDQPLLRFVAWGDDRDQGEDCLNLNVWTPTVDRGAKRPVLVWLHGGGFMAGSSRENAGYDGLHLSRRDAVVVSVNHRIGVLGFMDLSEAGGEFERSANAGMLDLVAALRWVRDNIAEFGGDPDRVTIFGQSGGGAKVSTLMAMPTAKGLFHRAVVMSGSFGGASTPESAKKLSKAVLQAAKLKAADTEALQKVDVRAVIEAGEAGQRALLGPGMRLGWQPVLNPRDLPNDWSREAPAISGHIPMIVGSVRDEFRSFDMTPISEQAMREKVRARYGDQGDAVIASIRRALPGLHPLDVVATAGALPLRAAAVGQASKQLARGAPVYLYWYVRPSPLFDGGMGVPHGADVDMFFDNVDKQPALTGYRAEAFALADQMAGALVNFAASGKPNYKNAVWRPFDSDSIDTMVFDVRSRMENDPAGEARKIAAASGRGPFG